MTHKKFFKNVYDSDDCILWEDLTPFLLLFEEIEENALPYIPKEHVIYFADNYILTFLVSYSDFLKKLKQIVNK